MVDRISGPDFICIGAQKAGTGWLYEQLRSHPDFWMPPLKEVHYFDRLGRNRAENEEDRLKSARKTARDERDQEFLDRMQKVTVSVQIDFASYAALFDSKGSLVAGDITPGYSTLTDDMVSEVAVTFPKSKVIFIARDPVERAWSQLSMWLRHQIIEPFDAGDSNSVLRHLQLPGIAARSFPSAIVRRWRKFVNPDLFRVYFFDDLSANPTGVRREIITFLGGDADKPSGALTAGHNPKATKEKLLLSDSTRAVIARFFESELKTCAGELGGPAAEWPARYGF